MGKRTNHSIHFVLFFFLISRLTVSAPSLLMWFFRPKLWPIDKSFAYSFLQWLTIHNSWILLNCWFAQVFKRLLVSVPKYDDYLNTVDKIMWPLEVFNFNKSASIILQSLKRIIVCGVDIVIWWSVQKRLDRFVFYLRSPVFLGYWHPIRTSSKRVSTMKEQRVKCFFLVSTGHYHNGGNRIRSDFAACILFSMTDFICSHVSNKWLVDIYMRSIHLPFRT